MSLDRKDVFQASKILVDFLRDFTLLSEQQLLATRKMMQIVVSQVMDSMMKVNEEAAHKKEHANHVLVKDGNSGSFVLAAASQADKNAPKAEGDQMREFLESRLLRNSGTYSKHLEAISLLDKDLQSLMAQVIGAVSVDDVIAQRLKHIIRSMQSLQHGLGQFLLSYKEQCTPMGVKAFRNKVLTEVYLSYTSEEEKEVFHRIFGHPRNSSKAS